jgi:glycosyltransferase involved in cell wall biosynthesis
MNAAGQIVCLNMIVKNEAAVIRRCLDSVRPIIDTWVIVDTGSTDGTQEIVRDYLRDLPGELHERPWKDFAHNRSEALALARQKSEYTFIIDADDTLEIAPGTVLPVLTADSYPIEIRDSTIAYQRIQLVRSDMPWRYEGVLHEYLACEAAGPSGQLPGIRMRRNHDGARRKDPETYRRDAAVLELALRTETSPFLLARYRFYLAQSYRDCREWNKALQHYLARAELGFWQEEVFVSLYCAAQMKELLHHPERDVIDAYLRAARALPSRVEALHGASRLCRLTKNYEEGYRIAKRGLGIAMPPSDALFVESWIYTTGLRDEYSLNAYWSGHYKESLDATLEILATGELPPQEIQRVVENARFASESLPLKANLGVFAPESFAEQHALPASRPLYSRLAGSPRVLVAILATQKVESLPLYLERIASLDYPRSSIVLYINTAQASYETELLLVEWAEKVGHDYAGIEFDDRKSVDSQELELLEQGATLPRVSSHSRQLSLDRVIAHDCDFYFVADMGNFLRANTLRELVALNLPIVAPFLRATIASELFSNFHANIDANGYFEGCDQYAWTLNRWVQGIIEMPVVNGTYLVRADVCRDLAYEDESARHPYVVFSESARKNAIPQYLDNRQVYGYVISGYHMPTGNLPALRDRLAHPAGDPVQDASTASSVRLLSY